MQSPVLAYRLAYIGARSDEATEGSLFLTKECYARDRAGPSIGTPSRSAAPQLDDRRADGRVPSVDRLRH